MSVAGCRLLKEPMHRYKVDAVVDIIIRTREQIERLKEIGPTLDEISIDASEDEKKLILEEIELLEKSLKSLIIYDQGN